MKLKKHAKKHNKLPSLKVVFMTLILTVVAAGAMTSCSSMNDSSGTGGPGNSATPTTGGGMNGGTR